MKVYIVSTGCYSDWSIARIFIDKEKAFRYAKVLKYANPVEEYETFDDYIDEYIDNNIVLEGGLEWNKDSEEESLYINLYGSYSEYAEYCCAYVLNDYGKWEKIESDIDNKIIEMNKKSKAKEKTNFYLSLGNKHIIIIRKIENKPELFETYKEKYKKVLYDIKAEIESLEAEGYNYEQIKTMIESKYRN